MRVAAGAPGRRREEPEGHWMQRPTARGNSVNGRPCRSSAYASTLSSWAAKAKQVAWTPR